jgi:hypothetical protein
MRRWNLRHLLLLAAAIAALFFFCEFFVYYAVKGSSYTKHDFCVGRQKN